MIRCLMVASLSFVVFGCVAEENQDDEWAAFAVTTPEQEADCLDRGKVLVCHYPPGRHPDKSFVICIADPAVDAHIDDADGRGHDLDFVVDRSDPNQPECGSDGGDDGDDGDDGGDEDPEEPEDDPEDGGDVPIVE